MYMLDSPSVRKVFIVLKLEHSICAGLLIEASALIKDWASLSFSSVTSVEDTLRCEKMLSLLPVLLLNHHLCCS